MTTIDDNRNVFTYKSPVGTFSIRYDGRASKWALGMDDEVYGHYLSPVAAASDVYCQVTGCNEWDSLDVGVIGSTAPTDIYEWALVRAEQRR